MESNDFQIANMLNNLTHYFEHLSLYTGSGIRAFPSERNQCISFIAVRSNLTVDVMSAFPERLLQIRAGTLRASA